MTRAVRLGPAQLRALAEIADRPGITRSDLARVMGRDPELTRRSVFGLYRRGLVAESPGLGTRLLLTITPAGREALGLDTEAA